LGNDLSSISTTRDFKDDSEGDSVKGKEDLFSVWYLVNDLSSILGGSEILWEVDFGNYCDTSSILGGLGFIKDILLFLLSFKVLWVCLKILCILFLRLCFK